MIKRYCDKCNKELDNDAYFNVIMRDLHECCGKEGDLYLEQDICPQCKEKYFKAFLA